MSRIGLKYVSPVSMGIPAINGGKWNIASNYSVDFPKVLIEVGIEKNDFLSSAIFLRFIKDGMFVCAAKRRLIRHEKRRTFESLWMYIPSSMEISLQELSGCIEELPMIFQHREAFESTEAFQDIVPEIFNRDFPDIAALKEEESAMENDNALVSVFSQFFVHASSEEPKQEGVRQMTGSRVGYLNVENQDELEVVLSAGFKKQYANFGLILLTDNPIKVESSLPGIFLPELLAHRQAEREIEEENRREEDSIEEKETIAVESKEIEIGDVKEEGEIEKGKQAEEKREIGGNGEEENEGGDDDSKGEPGNRNTGEIEESLDSHQIYEEEETLFILESAKDSDNTSQEKEVLSIETFDQSSQPSDWHGQLKERFDLMSFIIGCVVSTIVYIIITILKN